MPANGIEFDWDEDTRHLAAHGVMPAEFEQVVNNDPLEVDYELIDWQAARRNCVSGQRPGHEGRSGENPTIKTKRIVPTFATEADEAEWVQEPERPWQAASGHREERRSAGVDQAETDGADRGIQEDCGSSGGIADSASGSGFGAKAGRGKGFALPDLHQIAAA